MTTVTTSYWAADTSAQVRPTTVGGVLRTAAAAGPEMLAMVGGLPDPGARKRWTYALAYVLNQSGAVGIFLVPEFGSPMAAFLEEARPGVPSLREVVFFTDWASLRAPN
jgi:hypothetical protein